MAAFGSSPGRRSRSKHVPLIFVCCLISFLSLYSVFVLNTYSKIRQKHQENKALAEINNNAAKQQEIKSIAKAKQVSSNIHNTTKSQCLFRNYPKRRYYGLQEPSQPDFLQNAEYIYGKLPFILQVDTSRLSPTQGKLCVNQAEWHSVDNDEGRLPFADGTNPSILALERVPSLPPMMQVEGAKYLATICMTNSLCSWNDSKDDILKYNISTRDKPDTVRTLLLWLDESFHTLKQTTILLERNAKWGGGRRTPAKHNEDGTFVLDVRALDDARLFLHNNKIWISYRDGPNFGYDKQVVNPLHFTTSENVIIKASESVPFCCGRNMALMEHFKTKALQSLTWVDPVTVIDVNVTGQTTSRRRLSEAAVAPSHRRLAQKRESHFHGTNAFLVPYGNDELLGIGHFHRPPSRDPNEYSRHGHHYTHAFFTISANADNESYKLKRLSAEFVFPSKQYPKDADIIQFASGLELDKANRQLVIAYGINDCEGGGVHVDLDVLEKMLQPVSDGQQVVDLMQKIGS